MTLQERYEEWRGSPEGTIYSDGRPNIFTVEEWAQFKKLNEDMPSDGVSEGTKRKIPEIRKRRAVISTRSKRRRRDVEKNLKPGHWQLSLAVQGLKKDFDKFNSDLPHLLEGATRAYGLTELKVRKRVV